MSEKALAGPAALTSTTLEGTGVHASPSTHRQFILPHAVALDEAASVESEDINDVVARRMETAELYRALRALPETERTVICMRFGIGCVKHSRDRISEALGTTKAEVHNISRRAMRRLRGFYGVPALRYA